MKPEKARALSILPILLGAAAFLVVAGPRVIDPSNVAWLGKGDPATHYLGWLFFRHAPWSFPVGLNPTYGLEIGSAILFSDSIPLFALLFKPLSTRLPETFQYIGLWLLICFALQGWFGWKLVGLVTSDPTIRLLGAGLLVFSPSMIWRLHGHFSLCGHFLILAALYMAFRPGLERRLSAWATVIAIAALIHAYFLAMVAIIWLADVVGRSTSRQLAFRKAALESAAVATVIAVVCWQAGYFSLGGGVLAAGYGFFRMNLLSILDPSGWSYVLSDIPEAAGDYEGFNYLGLGVLIAAAFALPALAGGRAGLLVPISTRPVLMIALIGLAAFAVSNKVGLGTQALLDYELPRLAERAANAFRASGRMFWPVYYSLVCAILFAIIRGYDRRQATVMLALAFLVQSIDTSAGWVGIRRTLMVEPASEWTSPLKDRFWDEAARKYTRVRYIQPGNHTPHWQALATFAGKHRLATDAVYLARWDQAALDGLVAKAADALGKGMYDIDTLYVLDEPSMRQAIRTLRAGSDLLARVDGLFVLAPGWKKCEQCSQSFSEQRLADFFPSLKVGDRLEFKLGGNGTAYLIDGWSKPEPWGTWSNGATATIVLPLPNGETTAISIEAHPLVSGLHAKQSIEILVNGFHATTVTLTAPQEQRIEVAVPAEARNPADASGVLRLEFRFKDAARPKDIGLNQDDRMLALGIRSLAVR